MLGQCGPRIPRIRSLFNSSKFLDDVLCLQKDRQAELQLIWQEIGDDKCQKLEALQLLVSAAVNDIYERALDENMQRKLDLEEMVTRSESRLKELLGSHALQVIASRELPLQVRLNINMTCLKDVEHTRVDEYGWAGGLLVLAKLHHRIAALREILGLPPCDSVDLDELLVNTTEDLLNICPKKVALVPSKSRQKPIFQRMYHFYHMLCAIENVWVHSCTTKDVEKGHQVLQISETPVRQCLQNELKESIGRKGTPSNTALGSSTKRSTAKNGQKTSERRHAKLHSDEALALEQLSHKILRKLEKINKQVKSVAQPTSGNFGPLSPWSRRINSLSLGHNMTFEKPKEKSVPVSPSSDNNAKTPTSVLKPLTTPPSSHSEDSSQSLDACWVAQYESDLDKSKFKQGSLNKKQSFARNGPRSSNPNKQPKSDEESESITRPSSERWPLVPITNNPLMEEKILLPLPDIPPGSSQPPLLLSVAPPPPPPPPPPTSITRVKMTQSSRSARLRKSATISRLYLEMKKKMEGAASIHINSADIVVQRRTAMGSGSREGMAEALAEITRRSSYFRKIEDDVKKHAKSILEVKSRLLAFETNDMGDLLKFHASVEAQLEQLTDESQVLARFQGFPVTKLETVRAAASLYLKLSSLVEQIKNWTIEPPISEQLEKVNAFFDKLKTDVEGIERTRDEDLQRFTSQKVQFSFEIITSIKEAVVGLSSRCLASTLKECQSSKASSLIDKEYLCKKDMNKLRGSFQMLYKAFQLAFRVHNFAGGHDDRAEQLASELAHELETYPSSFWLELVNK